jgi:enterochelin esterase family protein
MKTIITATIIFMFVFAGTDGQELANFRRAPVVSPEIGEKTITFRLSAPQAKLVKLNGSWMKSSDLSLDMNKDTAGIWVLAIPRPPEELYTYNFIVDGLNINDPNNVFLQRDGTRYLSVLLVPGDLTANYFEAGKRGSLSKVWYNSPTIGTNRRMYVYTPYGYETGKESYPVLYLLHGAGGDEDAWATMGRACQILDNLIEKKLAVPMICVMPNGNPGQLAARTLLMPEITLDRNNPNNADIYVHSIVKDIVPYIEKNYRVIPKPDSRAIAGLSMGAGHTLRCTNLYPGFFSYICPLSNGIRVADDKAEADYDAQFTSIKKAGYKLYFLACGEDDFLIEPARTLSATLNRNGLKHTFYVNSGGHTWANWRIYLNTFAPLLFK